MESVQKIFSLKLRYPFGITREVRRESPTVLFRLGEEGQGEASPVRYKNQTPDQAVEVLAQLARDVTAENLDDIDHHDWRAKELFPEASAARTAFNTALWDARGRRVGKPLYELFGTEKPTNLTTYTISLADNETMEKRAAEAAHMPMLKVKLGRDPETDLDVMKRIRAAAPRSLLRIDANAGWDLETALKMVPELEKLGIEFVEQPLAIGNLDDLQKLTEKSELPIIADEDVQNFESLKPLVGKVHGINIKLMKCGGISEALRMIKFAREEGWSVLIGCMLETRCGLGAASHLAALVDYMDVDAHMLTTNDPFPPGSLEEFSPSLPLTDGAGLGLPFAGI